MIDYHIHTLLCNHAMGTMQEYINRAIAAGLSEICFLDHLTLNEKGSALSMTPEQVPLYYHAVRRLAEQYHDRIRVRAGLEIDFSPENSECAADIIKPYDFDVIAGSIHFLSGTDIVSRRESKNNTMDVEEICSQYLDLLERLVESRMFDVICHIDLPKKFSGSLPERFYENIDSMLEKIRCNGMAIEINTAGFDHPVKEQYPNGYLIEACGRHGVPVTLGSDAHRPEEVGRYFDRALTLMRNFGISSISGFKRRVRYDISPDWKPTQSYHR